MTTPFGLAPLKQENTRVLVDEEEFAESIREEATFWLEASFTKEQFSQLADWLQSSPDYFIRELGKTCREHAVNGYGGGI